MSTTIDNVTLEKLQVQITALANSIAALRVLRSAPANVYPLVDLPIAAASSQGYLIAADPTADRAHRVYLPDINAAAAVVGEKVDSALAVVSARMSAALADVKGAIATAVHETETQASVLLASLGYLVPVEYEAGLEVDSARFTVTYNGTTYAAVADSVPFTTGDEFDLSKWRVLQGLVASDLSLDAGANMIGLSRSTSVGAALTCNPMSNLYLGVFARTAGTPVVHFVTSTDGSNFKKINSRRFRFDGTPLDGYDPSICYHNGWFLVAVSSYVQDSYDARVYRSRDLVAWEMYDVTLGDVPVCSATNPAPGGSVPCAYVWAPEWVIVNDEIGILVSLTYAADTTDIDGSTKHDMRPYYSKMSDFDNVKFTAPVKLNMPSEVTRIDPSLIVLPDNTLIMAIKNEYSKKIEIYSGTGVLDAWTYKSDASWPRAEGPCITVGPTGTYRLYADEWERDHTSYVDTADFVTFTDPVDIAIDGMHRHGTIFNVGRHEDKAEIVRRVAAFAGFGAAPIRDGNFYLKPTTDTVAWNGTRLKAGTNTISPKQGYCYYVNGSDVAELVINGDGADEFYLMIRTGQEVAGITIPAGNFYAPSNGVRDYVGFGQDMQCLVKLVKDYNWGTNNSARLESGVYRLESRQNARHLGYFPWASRPSASGPSSLEIDSTDVGSSRSTWVSDGSYWVPKNPVTLARGTLNIRKSDSDTDAAVLGTTTIPASAMGLKGTVRVTVKFEIPNSSTTKILGVLFGGQTAWQQSFTTLRTITAQFDITNGNSQVAQLATADTGAGIGTTATAEFRELTVDTSVDQVLNVTGQWGTAGTGSNAIVLREWRVELLP